MNPNNKTALVTGSTSGIGLGIAKALAQQGANLVMNGFGDVQAAMQEVAALGGRVEHHPADLTRPSDIADLMRFASDRFGGVDRAQAMGVDEQEATRLCLGEKEPSMQFTTTQDIGQLALFFCSPAAANVRGVAWAMDGGWTAQ